MNLLRLWVYLCVPTMHCLVEKAEKSLRRGASSPERTRYQWSRGLTADFIGVKKELTIKDSSMCVTAYVCHVIGYDRQYGSEVRTKP